MLSLHSALVAIVCYGTFPATLLFCAAGCAYTLHFNLNHAYAFSLMLLMTLTFYITLEILFPCRPDWSMTLDTFLQRDAKFLVVNALTQETGRIAIGWIALTLPQNSTGPLARYNPAVSLAVLVLCFEFLQYWFHRLSHEMQGRIGAFLWRVHAAHHLPDRLYVMIHAIGHPLELLVTNGILMLGLPCLLGCSPDVTFLFLVFTNAIGIISHLNVDLRLSVLNYLFVGPEVHRFHHDRDFRKAGNYGAALTLFDWLFGTLNYRSGHPKHVGVNSPHHPDSSNLTAVLTLPFQPPPSHSNVSQKSNTLPNPAPSVKLSPPSP